MKSAAYKKFDCSVQIGCTYDVMETSFCKTMVLHAEKDVKEKTAKILRVKLSQKNHTSYGFMQGCPAQS